jgi:DNA polymerase-3 subunit epsilon
MGRCLSPCLGDLDPNLYRERLDAALALFVAEPDGGAALLAHVERQMRAASAAQRYERAAWLHRRLRRLEALLARLGGVLRAAHTGARLVLAPHPTRAGVHDAFWIVGGRIADWGPCPEDPEEVAARTVVALRRAVRPGLGGWLPAEELDEARIAGAWLAGHEVPALELDPPPDAERVRAFVAGSGSGSAGAAGSARLSSAA